MPQYANIQGHRCHVVAPVLSGVRLVKYSICCCPGVGGYNVFLSPEWRRLFSFCTKWTMMRLKWDNVRAINNRGHGEKRTSEMGIVILCCLLSIFVFIIDIFIPLGVAGGVPHVFVVLISLWSSKKRLPIYVAVGGSVLTVMGLYLSPAGGEMWKVLSNRFLAILAIWIVAILTLQRKKIQDEKERAIFELKILSGLLPICSSCKKIRDDKGCWNQLESYIRKNSEAEFSHGICNDCIAELYPDIDLGQLHKTS